MMAAVVGVMRKNLRRGGMIAADGRLQERRTMYELLWRRRLDSMHCACALDQGENDKMSAFFG